MDLLYVARCFHRPGGLRSGVRYGEHVGRMCVSTDDCRIPIAFPALVFHFAALVASSGHFLMLVIMSQYLAAMSVGLTVCRNSE